MLEELSSQAQSFVRAWQQRAEASTGPLLDASNPLVDLFCVVTAPGVNEGDTGPQWSALMASGSMPAVKEALHYLWADLRTHITLHEVSRP